MSITKEHGFAMLEVLISLLVILFGVLGIAGMQLMAINNTETARYQSVATMLASSMSAKMQTNYAYWSTVVPPGTITVTGSTIAGSGVVAPSYAGSCRNIDCTPVMTAAYDLKNWGAAMASPGLANIDGDTFKGMALPGASGKIECQSSTPMVCKLTISWSENNIALGNPTGTETGVLASGAKPHSYQTLVSIQQ